MFSRPVFFATVGAAGTVTDAEKAELQKEFSGYDLNHDDVIDEEELKKVSEGASIIPARPSTLLMYVPPDRLTSRGAAISRQHCLAWWLYCAFTVASLIVPVRKRVF